MIYVEGDIGFPGLKLRFMPKPFLSVHQILGGLIKLVLGIYQPFIELYDLSFQPLISKTFNPLRFSHPLHSGAFLLIAH